MHVETTINGRAVAADAKPRQTLAEWLRDDVGLKGTHLACEQGVCGSCTVLLDGVAVRSCLMLAVQASEREVTTVEGLVGDPAFAPLIEGFRRHQSFQCGFCTPGFIATCAAALADLDADSTDEQLRDVLSGNLCRCTGYQSIVAGLRAALRTSLERNPDDV